MLAFPFADGIPRVLVSATEELMRFRVAKIAALVAGLLNVIFAGGYSRCW